MGGNILPCMFLFARSYIVVSAKKVQRASARLVSFWSQQLPVELTLYACYSSTVRTSTIASTTQMVMLTLGPAL